MEESAVNCTMAMEYLIYWLACRLRRLNGLLARVDDDMDDDGSISE
jgi:hypothetical protein